MTDHLTYDGPGLPGPGAIDAVVTAAITAASAELQTGGMIALIPDNPQAFTVPGGDPAAQMHCTLAFLGDVSNLDDATAEALTKRVMQLAADNGPVSMRIQGVGVWNRDGGPDGTREPSTNTLLQLGSGARGLQEYADNIGRDALGARYPEQFTPWAPHICAGYNLDTMPKHDGVVRFSKIRLALAGHDVDYPLAGSDRVGTDDSMGFQQNGVIEMADTKEAAGPPEKIANALPAFWPCLAIEGMETSDGRYLEPGTIGFRQPPLSVYAQTTNTGQGGHSGAEIVGKLEEVWRIPGPEFISKQTGEPLPEGTWVWQARGELDGDSKGGDYAKRGYLTGNSIDLAGGDFTDDVMFNDDGTESHRVTVTNGMIGATTLCAIPAFADGHVEIGGEVPTINPDDAKGIDDLVAYLAEHGIQAVTASVAIPEYGDACSECLFEGVTEFAKIPPQFLKNAKGKKDAEDKADGGADEADENADGSKKTKGKPDFLKKKMANLPPVEWFTDPGFTEPTPLTITDDGRIFGHIATWSTCHIGVSKRCTPPPKSASDYAYFNTGALRARDDAGEVRTVAIGHLTMNTGHASLAASLDATVRHYDDTGTVAADVAAGQDRIGVWIAGKVRDELSDADMHKLLAAPPSGDWRPVGGQLEMVGVLAVNVPGYPVTRARVASGGETLALVAAGATRPAAAFGPDGLDLDALAERVAAKLASLLGYWGRSPAGAPDVLTIERDAIAVELEQMTLLEELRPFSTRPEETS
jgi:2'-5' RNA ligase